LYGAYGYVSYFLTGEHRNFDKSRAEFESIKPINNFSINDRTWGAWELAARYSHIDLNSKSVNINGGILNDVTCGVNWYLNPVMRIMFNYVHTNLNGKGYADGVQTRFQVEF
ncbi:MAG: porin, partial [Candidatus Omnitrophota bacterium]